MHPRNIYCKKPADFGELAEFRPSLKPFLIDKGTKQTSKKTKSSYTLNFADPDALKELTYAILEKDFELKMTIPPCHLVPAVPQKLNYIHWIEDLLVCGTGGGTDIPKGKEIIGVDIGTGTSCIYPLLGTRLNKWSFLATDISMDTVLCARENVSNNNFTESITVKLTSCDGLLKEALDSSVGEYSFTMCNPPFFVSEEERSKGLASRSNRRPFSCTDYGGTPEEMVTEGGEVGFVQKMVVDSLELRGRVRWYTSMLGKKSSLKLIMSELKSHQVPVVTTTEFVQGKTWRWGIAWSFDPTLKNMVKVKSRKRMRSHTSLQLLIRGAEGSVPQVSSKGMKEVKEWLEEQLRDLEIDSMVQSCDTNKDMVHSCDTSDGTVLSCEHEVQSCDPSEHTVQSCDPSEHTFQSCDSIKDAEGNSESCDLMNIVIRCTARKVTWSHQRQRKRLLWKLNHTKDSPSSMGKDEGLERRSDVSKVRSELSLNELQRQIEALSPPCHLEFTCSIKREDTVSPASSSAKRRKKTPLIPCKKGEGKTLCLEMKWTTTDEDRDQLHQIMQYLENKMHSKTFEVY